MPISYPNGSPTVNAASDGSYSTYAAAPPHRDTTPVIDAVGAIHFEGNITPHTWFQHPALRHEDGKANLVAITLLADICYWYKPKVVIDEQSGRVVSISKRFGADRLRWDHEQRGERFGLTKRQVKDAMAFLKERGIIRSECLDRYVIPASGAVLYNQVFVEPVPDAIAALCDLLPLPSENPSEKQATPLSV